MIESARWVCFECHGEKTVVVPSADFDSLVSLLRELHDGALLDPKSYDLSQVRAKIRSALDGGRGGTTVCTRCGISAFSHAMRYAP